MADSFSPDQGFVAEHDIKEDEEQSVKLQQTIELLLTAGYFRARIKGLTPFDKVVGGMVWCITTCSYDVDVDLLFQENSTIGQKIALTEKIVAVLPKMKCPHRIEPHQIQGLDFIHIFPVVQWLVKRAIETREETGDYIRAYAISQFDRQLTLPDNAFKGSERSASEAMKEINDIYRPKRKFKRHDASQLSDESTRVQSTLLEYGMKYGLRNQETTGTGDKDKTTSTKQVEEEAKLQKEEEKISELLSGMSLTTQQDSKLTASAVGSLVGLQSDEIQEIAGKFAEKQAEIERMEKSSPTISGAHHHKRATLTLQKQIDQQKAKLDQVQTQYSEIKEATIAVQEKLKESKSYSDRIDMEVEKLEELEQGADPQVLQQLKNLVAANDSLRKQEQEFRAHCKSEMERLQADIENVKQQTGVGDTDDEQAHVIDKQYAADKEKLNKMRLMVARKNREVSALQRKIDEVPTRAELSQYQRRFVELYNQIATKYKETKQFYTLYNSLDDTKLYLNKEVNLLNSIHDTFEQAMSSSSTKEQFLKQIEQIVEGVKQNFTKLEKRKQEEKMHRDRLNDQYLDLVEKQRVYFKTIKDFHDECRKNEILLSQLEQ